MFAQCDHAGRITKYGTRVCRIGGHRAKVTPEKCDGCPLKVWTGIKSVVDVHPPDPALPCRYRGDVLRVEVCVPCGGKVRAKVFRCQKFGECSIRPFGDPEFKACLGCDHHRPPVEIIPLTPFQPPGVLRRSLMFHLWPRLGVDWRKACASTFRYRHVFNGRILVTITTGIGCDRPEIVRDWLGQFGPELEIREVLNDPKRGINVSFRDQLRAMQGESGIVFKAHTKGVSHAGDACGVWRENMARLCLSDIAAVEQKFAEGYRVVVPFRTTKREGANVMGQRQGAWAARWPGWHSPGAFYWFDPRFIPPVFWALPEHYYENEAFPCHVGPLETSFSFTPNNTDYRSLL